MCACVCVCMGCACMCGLVLVSVSGYIGLLYWRINVLIKNTIYYNRTRTATAQRVHKHINSQRALSRLEALHNRLW